MVRCDAKDNYLSILFFPNDYRNERGASAKVRLRVDKNAVRETDWISLGSGGALAVMDSGYVTKELMNGATVVTEAEDAKKEPHRARFSLKGAKAAIMPVVFACTNEDK